MKTKFVAEVVVEVNTNGRPPTKKAVRGWIENALGDSGTWGALHRDPDPYVTDGVERVRVRSVDKD